MSELTPIDRLYTEASDVIQLLQTNAQISLQISVADHFRKALLLLAASYFEERVCNVILDYIRERAKGSSLIENFVRNKAVARQYHSWFAWGESNANHFFGLFGSEFRTLMSGRVRAWPEMQVSIKAFLELGNERNRLVHQNYATFPMEKTLDEVYALYRDSRAFVDALPRALRDGDSEII
jgi:hypothetical protein